MSFILFAIIIFIGFWTTCGGMLVSFDAAYSIIGTFLILSGFGVMITGVIGFIKTVLQLFSDSTNVWSLSFMESYKEYYGGYILEILITAIVMAIFIYLMNIWTKKKK